jgi:uncharacterized protein YjbI with pentapeptide repeats
LIPGTVFERCAFQGCTFEHALAGVHFRECSFARTRFKGAITDTTFVDTTIHEGRFDGRLVDSMWTKCALTRVRGSWNALRCRFHGCTFAAVVLQRHATWTQCTLDRTTKIVESTFEAAVFVDTTMTDVAWERCCLDRVQWTRTAGRRVTFESCGNHNAVFAGNRWHTCAWTRCGSTHTRHLSDHHIQTRVVACRRQHARFHHVTFARDVQDDTAYNHAEWERCTYTGSMWRRLDLHHAQLDHVKFRNAVHLHVDSTDATYRNVVRRASQASDVVVHRRPGTVGNHDDPVGVNVTLFGNRTALHGPVSLTVRQGSKEGPGPSFVLPATLAMAVDFVYVQPVAPWYSLGLSVPTNAHHAVPHVTVGLVTFYADKTSYRPEDRRGTLVGYRRRGRSRAHSH